jgi:hypothetical protein
MNLIHIDSFTLAPAAPQADQPLVLESRFEVHARILFELDAVVELHDADGNRHYVRHAHQDAAAAAWLPRGHYRWRLTAPEGTLPIGAGTLRVMLICDGPHPCSEPVGQP